jgi:lactoylglutathione lyase
MIPIRDLFESHLTVSDLARSMAFFGDTLGLKLARFFPERKVAFYLWIGGPGQAMLAGDRKCGNAGRSFASHSFTIR